MFAKIALAAIPLVSGVEPSEPKEGIVNLESHSFSVAREDLALSAPIETTLSSDGEIVSEPQGRLLFASARIAGSTPPSSLKDIRSDEIGTIVSAYNRALKRTDPELEGSASQLKGLFARIDWTPPQNGSPSRIHRDDSMHVTFDNVGKGVGDASYEVRALVYDLVIQLSLFERIPESEIEEIVGFMLVSSDGNPGVQIDQTKGLFRLTPAQFEAVSLPLIKSWQKKAEGKVELPEQFSSQPLEIERLIHDPFAQVVGMVSLYLEMRQDVKKSDSRGSDAPGFQANVWSAVAMKLATVGLAEQHESEQSELAKKFSERKTEISKGKLKGAEKATALKELEKEKQEAETALGEKISAELLKEERGILARIESGNKKLGEKGASGKAHSESFDSYLRLLQVNGQWD